MNNKPLLILAIALLMFAQIAQTLYSPALGDIGRAFDVGPQAAQTMSVYFLAFAFGVVTWGRVCDRIGRRPAMLSGLAIYAMACVIGLSVRSFQHLLMAQALGAFGAAVGSVVTQTLLRDRFQGTELAQVFSLVGMALAASPAFGLFSGAALTQVFGYRGVLGALLLIALALWLWSWRALPETRVQQRTAVSLFETLGRMMRDVGIWRSALWIASFNIALFSYYSLGPFMFKSVGLSESAFGYSGVPRAGLRVWRMAEQAFVAPWLQCAATDSPRCSARFARWSLRVAATRQRCVRMANVAGGAGLRLGDTEYSRLGIG